MSAWKRKILFWVSCLTERESVLVRVFRCYNFRLVTWIIRCLVPFVLRYVHTDPGTSPRLPKARFQQHAHNEISGSSQDSLHGLARCLLRPTALEAATNIRVQTANRERGHYIQVRQAYLQSVSSLSINCWLKLYWMVDWSRRIRSVEFLSLNLFG